MNDDKPRYSNDLSGRALLCRDVIRSAGALVLDGLSIRVAPGQRVARGPSVAPASVRYAFEGHALHRGSREKLVAHGETFRPDVRDRLEHMTGHAGLLPVTLQAGDYVALVLDLVLGKSQHLICQRKTLLQGHSALHSG